MPKSRRPRGPTRAGKSGSRKTATRRTDDRKSASRKTGTRKIATRKAASRKTASPKTAARKTATRKVPARTAPTRRAGTGKTATRKTADTMADCLDRLRELAATGKGDPQGEARRIMREFKASASGTEFEAMAQRLEDTLIASRNTVVSALYLDQHTRWLAALEGAVAAIRGS